MPQPEVRPCATHGAATGVFLAIAVCLNAADTSAQTTDRAASIKTWRENCSDPDPDLVVGYLEEAVAGEDGPVRRVCVRQALESDSADVQNLALSAAIAASQILRFEVTMPDAVKQALNKAAKSGKPAQPPAFWSAVQTGLSFVVVDGNVGNGTSTWNSVVNLAEPNPSYSTGQATVMGSDVNWTGTLFGFGACRLIATLKPGAVLAGLIQCADDDPYGVTARLL